MTACIASRFEQTERPVSESAEERTRIVNADLFQLASGCVLAFFDERLRHGRDAVDGTVQPDRGVDTVSQQVARHSGTGGCGIKSPESSATLWQICVDRPVLQEVGSIMEDAPQTAFVDELLCK